MLEKCEQADAYTGEGRPVCDEGNGCVACWGKHNAYLDANRPSLSPDFAEFYDYICMHKRVMQVARLKKEDFLGLYDWLEALERSIRTGEYRHGKIVFERTLAEMKKS